MVAEFKHAGTTIIELSTTLTVEIPATDVDDYGVIWLYQPYAITIPQITNWSVARSIEDGAGGVAVVYYRVYTFAESAASIPISVAPNGVVAKLAIFTNADSAAPDVVDNVQYEVGATSLQTAPMIVNDPTMFFNVGFIYQARTEGILSTSGDIVATLTGVSWDNLLGAYTVSTYLAEVESADGGTILRSFLGGTGNTWDFSVQIPSLISTEPPVLSDLENIYSNVAFNQSLVNSSETTTVSLISGTLPDGLTLSNNGVLSGTPEFSWTAFSFTLNAVNSSGSVSKTYDGYVLLEGETTRSTGSTGNTPWTRFSAIVGDNPVVMYVPTNTTPNIVVSMMHGADVDENFPDNEPAPMRDRIIDKGWVVLSSYAEGTNYAAPPALLAWDAAHFWLNQVWEISDVILYGASMGSQVALVYYSQQRIDNIRGIVIIDSLLDFEWFWDNAPEPYLQWIRDGYGFTEDSDFLTATAGHDPLKIASSTWNDLPIFVSYSYSDTLMVPSRHSLAFINSATGAEITVYEGTGAHSAVSNFAFDEVEAWMDALFIPEPVPTFAIKIAGSVIPVIGIGIRVNGQTVDISSLKVKRA